jgi:LEA14-like dessication related protein
MKLGKKGYWALAAVAGVTATTAVWAIAQYKKLMKNVTGYKSVSIKEVTKTNIALQVVYTYTNNMDVDVVLTKQKYDVYLDDNYITTLTNDSTLTLKAHATTDIPLNVNFNPTEIYNKLKINPAALLINPGKVIMRIDMKVWVKLLFFSIPITYSYEDKLTRMLGIKLPKLK